MPEQVEKIFGDMSNMLKKLKKATYKQNMERFMQINKPYFEELTAFVQQAQNQEAAGKQVADRFVSAVENKYGKGGKIKGRMQADMTFFMIYYVFPTILETHSDYATFVADTLCEEWSRRIAGRKIGYTTYEKLQNTFREKIFGIF